MATFVCNDPKTSAKKALQRRVDAPEDKSQWGRGHVFGRHKIVEEVESRGQAGDVAEDIGVPGDGRALEAMFRDGIADIFDGEVGRCERVAVRVEQASVLVFGSVDVKG